MLAIRTIVVLLLIFYAIPPCMTCLHIWSLIVFPHNAANNKWKTNSLGLVTTQPVK